MNLSIKKGSIFEIYTQTDWIFYTHNGHIQKQICVPILILLFPQLFFLGLFRNSSVCFGCFDMDPKHRNEPKQTEKIIYWFRETNRK
jgi:hypothetical protein